MEGEGEREGEMSAGREGGRESLNNNTVFAYLPNEC